jgi:cell wall-associated NlpC family hydrolase
MDLDPRINAIRPDLADAALKGRVDASRFVEGEPASVIAPQASLRREPSPDSIQTSEALYGEGVSVFETRGGWSWVQLHADSYVGWLRTDSLGQTVSEPNHKVSVLRALVFSRPDIKSALVAALPFGSRVKATGEAADHNARYRTIEPAGAVAAQHLVAIDAFEDDWVSVAERFMGVPYLWGGKTNLGIDCSGLIQMALQACGIQAPRDTDMQEAALGEALPMEKGVPPMKRGDIVFWKGHAGLMQGEDTLLHANAHHMAVAAEPLRECVERLSRKGLPVTSVRRIELRSMLPSPEVKGYNTPKEVLA